MANLVHFKRYGKRRKGWHAVVFPRKKNRPSEMLAFIQDRPGQFAYTIFTDRSLGAAILIRFYFTDPDVAFEFKMAFG